MYGRWGFPDGGCHCASYQRARHIVFESNNGVDMARFHLMWTELGQNEALVCSFDNSRAATSWSTGALPALPV